MLVHRVLYAVGIRETSQGMVACNAVRHHSYFWETTTMLDWLKRAPISECRLLEIRNFKFDQYVYAAIPANAIFDAYLFIIFPPLNYISEWTTDLYIAFSWLECFLLDKMSIASPWTKFSSFSSPLALWHNAKDIIFSFLSGTFWFMV